MPDEHEELQKLLEQGPEGFRPRPSPSNTSPSIKKKDSANSEQDFCQWETLPNGVFMATGLTKPHLTPGAYTIQITDSGRVLFVSKRILTDSLVDLGDSNASRVIEGVRLFWTRKAKYLAKGILYKRGVLLWGAPGSGKTATLSILIQELIDGGGIVLLVQNPAAATRALPVLRKIEPERPLIVVLEDIEEIVQNFGEHDLLALLDGEHQTDNVVNLASTNYPENLGARIVNRPSRFDEVHKISMPSNEMRYNYLVHALGDEVERYPVAKWVKDTAGLSVAHLKELVVAVTCLDHKYEDVLERLKGMRHTPKSQMYDSGAVGFTAPRPKTSMTIA